MNGGSDGPAAEVHDEGDGSLASGGLRGQGRCEVQGEQLRKRTRPLSGRVCHWRLFLRHSLHARSACLPTPCADVSSEEDEEGGPGRPHPGASPDSPLTQDVLQQAYQQQGLPEGMGRSSSSRGGSSWLRGRSSSVGGGGEGSALDDSSSVLSLDLAGEAVGADAQIATVGSVWQQDIEGWKA